MPKMTAKYKTALQTAREQGIALDASGEGVQEYLYRKLNDSGFWWDSKLKKWVQFAKEPANKPTPLVMIRVWADSEKLQEAVGMVKGAFANGFDLIQESSPYPCRPPQQLESRVYLHFKRNSSMSQGELIREADPFAVEIE